MVFAGTNVFQQNPPVAHRGCSYRNTAYCNGIIERSTRAKAAKPLGQCAKLKKKKKIERSWLWLMEPNNFCYSNG